MKTICNNCKFCKKKWVTLSEYGYGNYEFLCGHENNINEIIINTVSGNKSYYNNSNPYKYEEYLYPKCNTINKGDCKDYQPSWFYKLKMFFIKKEKPCNDG